MTRVPTAAMFVGRSLQRTPDSRARAGHDGHKKNKDARAHVAVDTTPGHLLALAVRLARFPRPERPAETSQQGLLAGALEPVDLVTPQFLEGHDAERCPSDLRYVQLSQSDWPTDACGIVPARRGIKNSPRQ